VVHRRGGGLRGAGTDDGIRPVFAGKPGASRLLFLLWVALAGCHTTGPDPVAAVPDGGYGVPPPRTVVNEFPDVAFPYDAPMPIIGGGISGGGSGDSKDSGSSDPVTAAPDAAVDAAPKSCSVLKQDCGATRGCYPAGGVGACSVAGDLGANTPCGEHLQCAPGLICVDAFGAGSRQCQPVCDTTAANSCRKGDICRSYAGTLGFCAQ
jgi:hypothetical protein